MMAKDDQSSQLNLTVVALVALVAIVGLVALVMNAASIAKMPKFATGSEVVSAEEQNVAGDARRAIMYKDYGDYDFGSTGAKKCSCGGNSACDELLNKKMCDNYGCTWSCK